MGFETRGGSAAGHAGAAATIADPHLFGRQDAGTTDRLSVMRGLLVMLRLAWLNSAGRAGGPNSRRDDHL